MLLYKPDMKFGDLSLKIYDFEFAGDVLPMHEHDEKEVHISIVGRGKIKILGDGWERELSSGQIIDFEVGQKHEFVAMEDDSRIINILKNIK